MQFASLFRYAVRIGSLTVIDANGRLHRFAGTPGPRSTIRLHSRKLHYQFFFNPWLKIGEAYMDGTLTCEEGTTIYDLVDVGMANQANLDSHPWLTALNGMNRVF